MIIGKGSGCQSNSITALPDSEAPRLRGVPLGAIDEHRVVRERRAERSFELGAGALRDERAVLVVLRDEVLVLPRTDFDFARRRIEVHGRDHDLVVGGHRDPDCEPLALGAPELRLGDRMPHGGDGPAPTIRHHRERGDAGRLDLRGKLPHHHAGRRRDRVDARRLRRAAAECVGQGHDGERVEHGLIGAIHG